MGAHWRVAALGAGAGLMAVAIACGSRTFVSEDWGLDAALVDASPTDALPPPPGDATVPPDGATHDAGPPPRVDPCEGGAPHTLCDDFDKPAYSAVWGPGDPCGKPTLDSKESVSAPNSLFSVTKNEDAGCASLQAPLSNITVGTIRSVTCAFDVRVDAPPSTFASFFTLSFTSIQTKYYEVALAYVPSQPNPLVLAESVVGLDGGRPQSLTVVEGLKDRSWHHITFFVDIKNQFARVFVDDASRATVQGLKFAPAIVNGSALHVGVNAGGLGEPTQLRHDNVVCDVP